MFGARVFALRNARAMSRRVLARRAGLSERQLIRIETGGGEGATVASILALAAALEVSPAVLIDEELSDPVAAVDRILAGVPGMSTRSRELIRGILRGVLADVTTNEVVRRADRLTPLGRR